MSKKALNLNIDELLFDKLTQYRKLKGVTATSVIEELINNLHLNVDKDVDTSLAHVDNVDNVDTIYITEDYFNNALLPFVERLIALEKVMLNPNEYMAVQNLDKYYADQLDTLQPYIKALVVADQDRLMDNLERQLDPTKDGMIVVIPEAVGQKS
jgi:hypothetical protein